MKAIILARVSSKEQEDGQSIPAQVYRAQQYVQRKGFELLETFEITESSTRNKRKQFEKVINIISRSKNKIALVCDCVDRLQRSFRETPLLDDLRKQGKLEIHFLREGLILNQEANSALLSQWDMLVVISSAYVRNLSDNVKRSKDHAVRNGVWVSKAPLGYKNVSSTAGKTLEIDLKWASFIRKIFELYATGSYSLLSLAKEMEEQGWTNGKGICKKEWVREEELLNPMLDYLDKIKVSDDLIEKIVDYLKKSFEAEQEFYKQTHENLGSKLTRIYEKIWIKFRIESLGLSILI